MPKYVLPYKCNCIMISSTFNFFNTICRTVLLPFVLYGCETCLLTLWEEYRPKVFNNRMLGKIFGPNRDEVTED